MLAKMNLMVIFEADFIFATSKIIFLIDLEA